MLTLKHISTECLLRNRSRIRSVWRSMPEPCEVFPMEKLYDAIMDELRSRGFFDNEARVN